MYQLYFLPKRVIQEYQQHIHGGKNLTSPIISRRVSAMIYATKYCRVDLGNGKYQHRFGHCKITVEENAKVVSKIEYTIVGNVSGSDGKFYNELCKVCYRLNDKHTDFASSSKNKNYRKDDKIGNKRMSQM